MEDQAFVVEGIRQGSGRTEWRERGGVHFKTLDRALWLVARLGD